MPSLYMMPRMTVNEQNVYRHMRKWFLPRDISIHDRTVLYNNHTGRTLEMDFYLPRYRLGIEVQGFGHHYPRSKLKDQLKYYIARRLGIIILYIDSPINATKIEHLRNQIHYVILQQSYL